MAIDTRDKRASAIACRHLPWMRRFLPLADASIDQGDRQQLARTYRGIPAAPFTPRVRVSTGFDARRQGFSFDSAGGWSFDVPGQGFGFDVRGNT